MDGKLCYVNSKHKIDKMAILASDKVDVKTEIITINKDVKMFTNYLSNIKGPFHQKDI